MFYKRIAKKLAPLVLVAGLAFGGFALSTSMEGSAQADPEDESNDEVKNIIFLIGDGMGTQYTTAYRHFQDKPDSPYTEDTAFDEYLIGMQETYSWDEEESVTDSAAAATTMAAGLKTYNGAIAVDIEKERTKTALEIAKEKGKATGLVSTSHVNHATPASFGAHNVSRDNYDEIADDYYDEMINGEHKVDVLLGGGTDYFEREDRDLVSEFQEDGYSYVTSREEMLSDYNEQVLGLFAPEGMDKMIDRDEDTPSLEEMTSSALDRLSEDDDGFFLMVEGSQIDWAGHDNDIVASMSEMEDFEKAFEEVIAYAKEDEETLVITTADHTTGGMSMGRDGEYKWDPAPLKAAERTPDFMASAIADGADAEETLNEYVDLSFTEEEIESVEEVADGEAEEIDDAIEKIFDLRSGTGWTTSGHTGEDVNVYGYGPQSDAFSGLHDNHEVGQMIMNAIESGHTQMK